MSPKFGEYYLEADFATLKNAGKNKVQDNKDGGAGNTCIELLPRFLRAVYPRWRGEHIPPRAQRMSRSGLSPLARGTRWCGILRLSRSRFIPAGAGNTELLIPQKVLQAVYPRWRGEHKAKSQDYVIASGLSPLARGTPSITSTGAWRKRFIPAGAGNTPSAECRHTACAVYPRWRGEHTKLLTGNQHFSGLSPLARGTPGSGAIGLVELRFIPAGAGNTSPSLSPVNNNSVYPRWRGEHFHCQAWRTANFGLSPLARGTRCWLWERQAGCGFIPAGAGNTGKTALMTDAPAVYPRWRGEHPLTISVPFNIPGLSPLARGTL